MREEKTKKQIYRESDEQTIIEAFQIILNNKLKNLEGLIKNGGSVIYSTTLPFLDTMHYIKIERLFTNKMLKYYNKKYLKIIYQRKK